MTKKIFFAITLVAMVLVGCEKQKTQDPFTKPTTNPGTVDPEKPQPSGDILTVAQAIAKQDGKEATVKGFVVGWYNGHINAKQVEFSNQNAADTTVNAACVVIADAADCKDASLCLCVQLPSGNVRAITNLKNNPDNLGKELIIKGKLTKYNTMPGLKECTYAEIGGTKSTDLDVQFYCYRVKLGDLDAATVGALKVGDKVVLSSTLVNYKGNTPETKTGKFISINGEVPAGAKTAAECIEICKGLKADTETTDTYTIAGEVTRIAENGAVQFKNMTFYIK